MAEQALSGFELETIGQMRVLEGLEDIVSPCFCFDGLMVCFYLAEKRRLSGAKAGSQEAYLQ